MNRKMKRIISWFLTGVMLVSSMLTFAGAAESDFGPVTITDSTTTFNHFDYTLNADYGFVSGDPNTIVSTVFNTKVVENDFIKATFLPDYGARLLSIVYKPTGHELLYQNPVGTPYGIGEGNFYYDWLMVYGGIMPTMSEPEHGKYWLEPWDCEIVTQNSQQVSLKMTKTDTIDFSGRPWKFNKGATGMTCSVIYTIYADKPYVEMEITLTNNQGTPINYEYWTCNTLAPGSTYGNTIGSESMEIVAPLTKVKNKDDWWSWMGSVDEVIDANNHIFEFKNLAHFSNWEGQGISYGNDLSGDWWGVINHDNEEGVLRISDNEKTPGLKMWTWGCEDSFETVPETDYGNSARPYIELWGGTSMEFFENAILPAYGQISWTEYYYPTVGLENITNANEDAAIYLWAEETVNGYELNGKLNTTLVGEDLTFEMNLKGSVTELLSSNSFVGNSSAKSFSTDISSAMLIEDVYTAEGVLRNGNGEVVLIASIPLVGIATPPPVTDLADTWYLYNTVADGVRGESLQADHSDMTGWQPVKTITSEPNQWYTINLSGEYAAGTWDFTLWTAPANGETNVTVALYKTNYDGSESILLDAQTLDVSATGTGNHPSLYSLECPAVVLDNERIMVQIIKESGEDIVMCYNTNDFPTRLETP